MMPLYDDKIRKIKEEFTKKVRMSFQMEAEFEQIVKYLLVNEADHESFFKAFFEENGVGEGTVGKNEAKKLLEKLREKAIRETKVKRPTEYTFGEKARKHVIAWVEQDIKDDPRAKEFCKNADEIRTIKHYKDVFNAKEHNFKEEKRSGNFIVAKNRDALVYPGAPFCQSFGNEHFYYTSCVKNCIFDCDYCFLQGLYPCGYPVYFVNLEDYFAELDTLLQKFPVYLCISYDTDLLASEQKLHYVEKWISYAQTRPDLKIEIRTKSGNLTVFKQFDNLIKTAEAENHDNIIFAWTISPAEVSEFAEIGLPDVEKRLQAVRTAKKAGFPVRICFDPMIFHPEWKETYKRLFKTTFNSVRPEDITDVSLGVFRISNKLLKRMRDANANSPVTQFPYITENGACHYGSISSEMMNFAKEELKKYIPEEKIYAWEGN